MWGNTSVLRSRYPIIGSPPPEKASPGRQFIGKNSSRIFAGKLWAGGAFSGGRSYNGETLWGRRYFNKGETYQIRDCLLPDGFFTGRHFNVTPALCRWLRDRYWMRQLCGQWCIRLSHYLLIMQPMNRSDIICLDGCQQSFSAISWTESQMTLLYVMS